MILIDSHCHLNKLAETANLDDIMNRAKDNGVGYLQTICTTFAELPEILLITEKYDNVLASCGVHPNDVKTPVPDYQTIIDFCSHPKIIGIGETGLDYYYQTAEKELQILSFLQHIIASQHNSLPVIVHTREAEEDTIEILSSEMKNAPFPGLIHCFTSSKYLARKMLDLGLYISISGIITFKNAEELQEIVRYIPLDRLLIETDSPYLAPVPKRGKQNEPSFVIHVADKIAELKSTTSETIAEATSQNFFSLFKKAKTVVTSDI